MISGKIEVISRKFASCKKRNFEIIPYQSSVSLASLFLIRRKLSWRGRWYSKLKSIHPNCLEGFQSKHLRVVHNFRFGLSVFEIYLFFVLCRYLGRVPHPHSYTFCLLVKFSSFFSIVLCILQEL